ncbi:MAG: glycosyltransferase family 2 protein [Candidatus Andersenbacteria bacterium]|nr:glycosyltransferase family 2 protein [Candidatus Andersenbacteria bacterium]MBI3250269.1 glycosyltransferase family 2 protein [Candidatus Andersenbacteria bacterium]
MSLTVVITAKNEEKVIARAIQSATFADEIIVVDDSSQDRTAEIVTAAGARIIQNEWEGYGSQKNRGLSAATSKWVFFLDADEEISPALRQEITTVLSGTTQYSVYWVRVVDIFLGRPLKHLTGNNPRLVRKGQAQWTNRAVHEQMELINASGDRIVKLGGDNSGMIPAFLIHHSHATVSSYLEKMHGYTSLDAAQMAASGKHRSGRSIKPSKLLPCTLAVRQFIKLAFYRGGLRDGYAGFMWALLSGYYEWEMGNKYLNMVKKHI